MDTSNEAIKLLAILPEEIWLQIAEKINDAGSFLGLYYSSTYFRNLFKYLRVLALFPKVADVFYAQFQHRPKTLKNVLANCRLVCHRWEKGVDAVVQNSSIYYKLNKSYPGRKVLVHPAQSQFDTFLKPNQLERFQQHFDGTHANRNQNPFSCRGVFIWYGYDWEANSFIEPMLDLLRKYGHHIWHCSVVVHPIDVDALSCFKNLYKILKLLPNLKSLYLACAFYNLSDATKKELELYAQAHPFPIMKHLRYVSIEKMPTALVLENILRVNQEIIILDANTWLFEANPCMIGEELQKLQRLAIVLLNEQQLQKLEVFSSLWHIKKLCVETTQHIPPNDLFRLFEKCLSNTLTKLTLFLYGQKYSDNMPPLKLPNLKTFSLVTDFFTTLDFLLPTKHSLKHLIVRVDTYQMSNLEPNLQNVMQAEETVKFFGFRKNLIESNIWAIFPELRSIVYYDRQVDWPRKPAYRRFDWMLKQIQNA